MNEAGLRVDNRTLGREDCWRKG